MLALPRGILAANRRKASAYNFNTNLTEGWALGEASGTRAGMLGVHNLTDNNTVTQATGKNGNAAEFANANNEYLSVAHHADFSPGLGDMTAVFWVYPTATSGVQGLYSKWDNNTNKEHCCYIGIMGARVPSFIVTNNGNTDNQLDWGSALTQNAWSMIACVYDYAATTMKLSVNGGTFVTKSHTGGIYGSAPSPKPFFIGKDQSGVNSFSGRMDEFLWYKGRAFIQAEVTDLYNSGTGRFHPTF